VTFVDILAMHEDFYMKF